jgi:RimJ/RimL family protein N-acetyltransferase
VPHLFGERIRLRAAEREDIPIFLRWINDPEVTENLDLVEPMAHYQEENWYETMMDSPIHQHVHVIEVKVPNQETKYRPIGNCSFIDIEWRNRSAEVGIMIGEKSYWSQGYGPEALQVLIDHGFNTLNLHRIWLRVYAKNTRGIRAYEKVGFVHEGKYRQAHFQHGQYFDVLIMSVLKDEWSNRKIN